MSPKLPKTLNCTRALQPWYRNGAKAAPIIKEPMNQANNFRASDLITFSILILFFIEMTSH